MAEEPEIDIAAFIDSMARQTEPMIAMVSGATVEDWLVHALKSRMQNLSNKLTERLFEGYGPLGTFSGKIDIGYALGLFDVTVYNDLRAIKDIRNAFAHSKEPIHFSSQVLAPLIQKLTGWNKDADARKLFNERTNACVEAFKKSLDRAALVKALLEYAPPGASPDKSREPHPRPKTILDGIEEEE